MPFALLYALAITYLTLNQINAVHNRPALSRNPDVSCFGIPCDAVKDVSVTCALMLWEYVC